LNSTARGWYSNPGNASKNNDEPQRGSTKALA
jgi:hypothetical protein